MRTIVDRNATFVPAAARIFARIPEIAERGRAVLFRVEGEAIKLSLEAGERELWVSRIRLDERGLPRIFAYAPTHERRLAEIEITGSIDDALHEAKAVLGA